MYISYPTRPVLILHSHYIKMNKIVLKFGKYRMGKNGYNLNNNSNPHPLHIPNQKRY